MIFTSVIGRSRFGHRICALAPFLSRPSPLSPCIRKMTTRDEFHQVCVWSSHSGSQLTPVDDSFRTSAPLPCLLAIVLDRVLAQAPRVRTGTSVSFTSFSCVP
jgi:hypothetical protein